MSQLAKTLQKKVSFPLKKKVLFAAWASTNKRWHTYQLFDKPLRRMFSQVAVFDPHKVISQVGKKEMNRQFLAVVEKEQPDYIFLWLMHEEFYPETLIKIKEISPKSISMCYNGDDDYKFENYTSHLFPLIDYFLSTQPNILPEYRKLGKPVSFSCGADTQEFKPLGLKKEIDVSFVGTPKNDRIDFMRFLIKNGINAKVFGAGWEKYPEFKNAHLGEIDHHEFIEVINKSKINICLSKNYFGGTHILERFFEINACRSFGLTEHASGYFPTFKEGEDIVTFRNKEELLNKVKYFLKNDKEREEIASKAYKKTLQSYSNQQLFEKAISFMENNKENVSKSLPKINKKCVYLSRKELLKGKDYLTSLIGEADYVSFKSGKYEDLPYKEYCELNAHLLFNKPVVCCDSYLSSSFIGDYASVALYYAYDLQDKRLFYGNLDLEQLMIQKDYFLQKLDHFVNFAKDKSFLTKENCIFISIPLVRTNKINFLSKRLLEHTVFDYFNLNLLVLKNKHQLFSTSYMYKLIFYSLFINQRIMVYLLTYTLKKTKNKKLMALASFFDKWLK
jgi:spore maturation protein CgeB